MEVDSGRNWRRRQHEGAASKVNIVVFELRSEMPGEGVFDAAAQSPAGTPSCLRKSRAARYVDIEFLPAVCHAALGVDESIVERPAQARGRSAEPVDGIGDEDTRSGRSRSSSALV